MFLLVFMLFWTESLPTSPLLCSWYWYSGMVCDGCFFLSVTQVVWWRRHHWFPIPWDCKPPNCIFSKCFNRFFRWECVSRHLISFKIFLFFVLGQNLDIKPPDGLPILTLEFSSRDGAISSPVLPMMSWIAVFEIISLCQPQWSFAMTLLIYLYLVTWCMWKCISNTPDVVESLHLRMFIQRPKT